MIGIAISEGYISSVDQPASDFLPAWVGTDKEGQVTIRDILTMKSGLRCPDGSNGGYIYYDEDQLGVAINRELISSGSENSEDPTRPWVYCNSDSMLLGEIVRNATGYSAYEFGDRFLFSILGMQADWWRDPLDNYLTYCCIDATSRDFGRFGLLWLNRGVWQGRNLLPAEFVDQALTQADIAFDQEDLGYGFQWYIQSLFKDEEIEVQQLSYGTKGFHMNNIWLFPGLDMVVVRNSLYNRVLEAVDDTVRIGDLDALFRGEDVDVNVHGTLAPYNGMFIRGEFYPYNMKEGFASLQESRLIRMILESVQ